MMNVSLSECRAKLAPSYAESRQRKTKSQRKKKSNEGSITKVWTWG